MWQHKILWAISPIILIFSYNAHSAEVGQPIDMNDRVQACTPCHGQNGQGTKDVYFPRLAGKPSGYLFNQLVAFKNGRRHYPPMNYLLAYLPNDYLRQMANHFAAQRPSPPPPDNQTASPSMIALGKSLVHQGDFNRDIPACVSCHGPELGGMEPGIPGLLGLRGAYISAQLGGWRYGTRTAIHPDCMQVVAGRLTENDVTALADYLSSLSVSANSAPMKQGSYALPFACGSQPEASK